PGTARTYEVRDVSGGMVGARWNPVSHAWHGTLPAEKGVLLGGDYGLKPQAVPTIETFSAPGPVRGRPCVRDLRSPTDQRPTTPGPAQMPAWRSRTRTTARWSPDD